MSIKDGLENPFIYVLMPMAAASDIVFQAMIAFSGVIYQQQHSASFAQATWGHYAQAIRSLKHALTLHVEHQADRGTELLATVLLLLSLEVSRMTLVGVSIQVSVYLSRLFRFTNQTPTVMLSVISRRVVN